MEELHELEEPQMMGEHEECLDSQVVARGTDVEVIDAQESQEPLPLESSLMTHDETFEYPLTDNGDSAYGDTSIQCPELVDTHGLNDTMLQPRHRVTSRVTIFTISTVVGSIHYHRMLPGGKVVDSGILGTTLVSNSEKEHAESYGDMQRDALEDRNDAYLVG
jgi:hypothetical protein